MSLPSASGKEPQTILEKQNKNIISQLKSDNQSNIEEIVEKKVETSDEELESEEESSEGDNNSDNEVIEVKQSFKFKKLSEESLDEDETDREIKEILKEEELTSEDLQPQEPLEKTVDLTEKSDELDDKCDDDQSDKQSTIISGSPPKDPFLEERISITDDITNPHKETIIDEDLLPKGALDKYNTNIDHKDRPPVPLQTYLWEDVKRSKEQVSDNVCKPNVSKAPEYKNLLNISFHSSNFSTIF